MSNSFAVIVHRIGYLDCKEMCANILYRQDISETYRKHSTLVSLKVYTNCGKALTRVKAGMCECMSTRPESHKAILYVSSGFISVSKKCFIS